MKLTNERLKEMINEANPPKPKCCRVCGGKNMVIGSIDFAVTEWHCDDYKIPHFPLTEDQHFWHSIVKQRSGSKEVADALRELLTARESAAARAKGV